MDSTSTLAANHLANLRKSGLSDEQITACGFRTLRQSSEAANVLRWKRADTLGPCLLLPYHRPDGSLIPVNEFARIKPDTPRTGKTKDGSASKPRKYESPKGSTVRLYFPPATCKALGNPSIPKIFVEGEKKTAKGDQEGLACIGLGGVESWSKKREKGPDGRKLGKRELIDDFNAVALNGCEVFIVFDSDRDEKPSIQWAEWSLSQALAERGAVVKVVRLPNGPPDANGEPTKIGLDDYLVAHSVDEFRELLKAAIPPQKPERKDDRVEIVISTDEAIVNELVIQALAKDDQLFQRAGKLVCVVSGANHDSIDRPEDAPRVLSISLAGLRERLTRFARFVTVGDEDERNPAHPPRWCYEAVAVRGQWSGIRSLAGIVTAPVLRPDGSVLNSAGYDPQTGLLFDPQGVSFPIVERPSHGDAIRAADSLLDLVADFPFAKPEHRAAWLAYLLTALARFAFDGPAPLFLVDANIRGSGKSLLCDLVALIVSGREMSRMSNPKDDDECRKRITALAIAGDTLCLIDNIIGGLGCASLDAALTGTVWKDRVLGSSEIVELLLLVTWSATGNNVALHADTARRVTHIRLDSRLENPEERDGFKHPNLKAYVRQHRPKLLADALTILAAFCRAGRPQQKLPTWGSFEGWSDLVRQAVVWCGQGDPGATRTELVEQSDREAIALRELLAGWDELDPDCFGLTTAEILTRLIQHPERYEQVRNAVLELCPPQAGHPLPSPGSFGKKLGHLRGRVVSGRFIDRRPNRKKTSAWFVSGETAGDDGDAGVISSPLSREEKHLYTTNAYRKGGQTTPASPSSPASPPPSPCESCGSGRLWRSHHGPHLICGYCHAPATPAHVADWIEVPPGLGITQRRASR